jgi:hypothetical protein
MPSADLRVVPPRKRLEPPFDMTVPARTPGSDEALATAGARLEALVIFWNEQDNTPDNAYADEVSALHRFIALTPAIGAAGVRVKLKLFASFADLDLEIYGWVRTLIESMNETLDRLAKGGVA